MKETTNACNCECLRKLWKAKQKADELSEEFATYGDIYLADKKTARQNANLETLVEQVTKALAKSVARYNNLIAKRLTEGAIIAKKNGKKVDLEQAMQEDSSAFKFYCARCDAEIPRAKYKSIEIYHKGLRVV